MATNDEVAKSFEKRASPSFDAMIHVGVWLSIASKRQQHGCNEETSAQNAQQTE